MQNNVTAIELADVYGVSDRHIRRMAIDGLAIKATKGEYKLSESCKAYISHLKAKELLIDKDTEELDKELLAEKILNERAKARKATYIADEIEKQLHKTSDVENIWNNIITNAKTKLLALPVKLANEIDGDFKTNKDIIYRGIAEALNELANYNTDLFYKPIEGEDIEDTE